MCNDQASPWRNRLSDHGWPPRQVSMLVRSAETRYISSAVWPTVVASSDGAGPTSVPVRGRRGPGTVRGNSSGPASGLETRRGRLPWKSLSIRATGREPPNGFKRPRKNAPSNGGALQQRDACRALSTMNALYGRSRSIRLRVRDPLFSKQFSNVSVLITW